MIIQIYYTSAIFRLNFWLSQGRFQAMEWHLFGDFFTRFIVTVQPIWDRKYRAWTCSVVEILGLDSILEWHWTTQQVFKGLKHKSLLKCKALHSHVFFFPHGLWFRAIKAFLRDSTTNVCEKSMSFCQRTFLSWATWSCQLTSIIQLWDPTRFQFV